jgi:hypothetical protein
MRRITNAGQNLAVLREELRVGLVKDKSRVINVLRELSPRCESIRTR